MADNDMADNDMAENDKADNDIADNLNNNDMEPGNKVCYLQLKEIRLTSRQKRCGRSSTVCPRFYRLFWNVNKRLSYSNSGTTFQVH